MTSIIPTISELAVPDFSNLYLNPVYQIGHTHVIAGSHLMVNAL